MAVRRARAVVLLLAAGVSACDAPTVPSEGPAYEFRLPLSSGSAVYHFPLGHNIAVYVDTRGAPDDRDLPAAVQHAFDAWRLEARYGEFDFHTVASPAEAEVTVHFDTDSVVSTACGGPTFGAAGVTTVCTNDAETAFLRLPLVGGGTSGVVFDVQISASDVRVPDNDTFVAIVTHEFGHVLGIGTHSSDPGDLMYGAPSLPAPSARDAQTLRYLLHQPAALQP